VSRARSSRGNHAAATTSTCSPTVTVSDGTTIESDTRSGSRGGGAASSSARAIGDSPANTPGAPLSTVTAIGSVDTSTLPWRALMRPITRVPA